MSCFWRLRKPPVRCCVAGDGLAIAPVAREDLVDQHVRRFDTSAKDTGNQADHRVRAFRLRGRSHRMLAHGRAQSTKSEAGKYRLYLVDNPRLLTDQILTLTVRSPRVLLLDRRDCHHAAMALFATQPAEKDAH